MVGLLDEFDQLIGHDAAADLAPLFNTVADAAVEGKAVRGHLGGLVAAAPLRHIQRLNGHVLRFPQGLCPAADADGDGEVHAGVEGADLIQHIVAALGILLQMALFHHGDIPAAGHSAQKAAAPADHLFQHPVDALQKAGTLAVQHIAENVVVAVHEEDHVAGAAGLVFSLHPAQRGLLVEDQQGHALALARHGGAVDAPHPVRQVELLAGLFPAELEVQPRQQLLRPAGQAVLAAQQPLAEFGVVPQHRLAGEHRRRLGQGFKAVLGLGVLEASARHPACQPVAQPAAEHPHTDAPQHHQHSQHRPVCRAVNQQHQGQQGAEDGQRTGQHLKSPSRFLFHQIFCLLICRRAPAAFVRPPSGWGGSSGCAWCGGRYS